MKKTINYIVGLAAIALLVLGLNYYWHNLRGVGPAIKAPKEDITQIINTTGMPLKLPEGFSIEVFTKDLPNARDIVQDSLGNFWVSQTSEGTITYLEVKDGKVVSQNAVFKNLDKPSGLALSPTDPFKLYFSEQSKISSVQLYADGNSLKKIADLPSGGRHFSRTLGFGPDGRLYVSIGSSCDVCVEKDQQRGTIYSMKPDGSDFKQYAKGLRNSPFFTWSPVDGKMWATEMGRDMLGDNLPPDEINVITEGGNYGWPNCYGKNIHDTSFDKNTYIKNPCEAPQQLPSTIDLQAHSAPLGLAFVPEEGWPEKYWYNLLVAYHGSWNRTEATGYKIARIILDSKGNYKGTEDFITGWLDKDGKTALGRPVQILTTPGGVMYITDDKAGVVYKVWYGGEKVTNNFNAQAKQNLIAVKGIADGAQISSPLMVEGSARGNWFFEASFPVKLLDGNGKEIATAIAQAQSDWRTTDFVDFKATLNFTKPSTPTGKLILQKDNPSGLPQNEDHLEIEVKF